MRSAPRSPGWSTIFSANRGPSWPQKNLDSFLESAMANTLDEFRSYRQRMNDRIMESEHREDGVLRPVGFVVD